MIRLHLFGSLELRRDDGTKVRSVLAQPKRTALLMYLAAQPRGAFARRDALAALFWPEMEDARARRALTKSLHFLRQSLGKGVIATRGEEDVGLDAERLWSDVRGFKEAMKEGRLEEAHGLAFRGELGTAFHLGEAPDFERWLDDERDRVRRDVLGAALTLSHRAEGSGDLEGAARWVPGILDAHPLHEPSARRLMELLDALGDRGGALVLFERLSARLRDELDVEPGPETREVAERIRARDGSAVGSPQPAPSPPAQVNTAAPPSRTEGVPLTVAAGVSEPGTTRRRRRWPLWVASLAAVALAVAAAVVRPWAPSVQAGKILVVPLENRTGDTQFDPLGEMAADWLARGLQQTGLAQVVDPLSAIAMTLGVPTEGLTG